jgi:hypothetical protein
MQLSVPAEGGLRHIAGELATRIAAHLGAPPQNAESIGAGVDRLAARLKEGGSSEESAITLAFRHDGGDLVVQGRCEGEATEIRHPLAG